MSHEVVSDAGPLIALARTQHLSLLERLFERVLIPEAVRDELALTSERPGAQALSKALARENWLVVRKVRAIIPGSPGLGPGESEAIALAGREGALLLIDDRLGRRAARSAGLRIIGTGRVLLAAKRDGLIERVSPVLDELGDAGYRLSDALVQRLKQLAGER